MPQARLDGSGRINVNGSNVNTKQKFSSLYPEIRRRPPQLEESMSVGTTASSDRHTNNGNNSLSYLNIPRAEESTRATSNGATFNGATLNGAVSNGNSSGHGDGERRSCRKDPVIFSCFAPPEVRPGTGFDLKVRAYLRHMRDAALREARADGATEAGRPGGMRIARGKRVTVELVRSNEKRRRDAEIEGRGRERGKEGGREVPLMLPCTPSVVGEGKAGRILLAVLPRYTMIDRVQLKIWRTQTFDLLAALFLRLRKDPVYSKH